MTNNSITKDYSMESFEKIVPLIFFIIWAIVAVLGKKKKQKAPPPDKEKQPAPATPFNKLQNTFKDLFVELEQPVAEELPETLKPKKAKIPEVRKTRMEKERDREIEIEVSDKEIKPLPPEPAKVKPSYQTHTRKTVRTAVPVSKLREAIIWSEILAKPVSMRDG
jgi:hypothetical protein